MSAKRYRIAMDQIDRGAQISSLGYHDVTKPLRWFWVIIAIQVVVLAAVNCSAQDDAAPKELAAWEYRPYNVAVWVAHDNSNHFKSIETQIIEGIKNQSTLVDPSGWSLNVSRAADPWNWRILDGFDRSAYKTELKELIHANQATIDADKLIVVSLHDVHGMVKIAAQELDLKTQIWGAVVERESDYQTIANVAYDAIATAFMPIARIERVNSLDVKVRVRAAGIVYRAEEDAEGRWSLQPNVESPVWVGDEEILLPVILRTDRRGNLATITPVEWTFLSIVDREGPHLNCATHSMHRASLGGRTGGRTERLALCVRAPNRASTLRLISREETKEPLQDLEIFSRHPGMDKDELSEFLGKTDWRGEIKIPPNQDGIRILMVKSGQRRLARVPVVPGLYDFQVARMPNDEKRLYAEGIVRGLQNKLMDNLAKRQVYEARIERFIEAEEYELANQALRELRNIPDSKKFNVRLGVEEKKLLSNDERENGLISKMFEELETLSSQFLQNDVVLDLSQKLREASGSDKP